MVAADPCQIHVRSVSDGCQMGVAFVSHSRQTWADSILTLTLGLTLTLQLTLTPGQALVDAHRHPVLRGGTQVPKGALYKASLQEQYLHQWEIVMVGEVTRRATGHGLECC